MKLNEHESGRDEIRLPIVLALLVAFGAVVRIVQYLHYRSLFHDEAVLASNVLDRSFLDLFLPYSNSMAPGAYMALTRVAIAVGGINEYAARFVPFAGGLLLLLALYPVARRLTTPMSAVIAVAFLAVSKFLIEFSDFVRPYSTDALVAIGLIGFALYVDSQKPSWLRYAAFGILGACSIWFSYPATFVLAGIGVVQIGFPIVERNWERLGHSIPSWGLWALSFLLFYVLSVRNIRANEDTMFMMNDYYQYANAFMPFPPTSFTDLKWFNYHAIKTFEHPGGLTLPGLGAFAFALGCVSLFMRNKKHLAYLLVPVGMALVASGLERYPFWARTILWLAPILYIVMGEGIAYLWSSRNKAGPVAAVVLLTMLVFVPGVRALRMIPNPSTHHELNTSLDYVDEHWEEGDTLYLLDADADTFRFCEWRYDFASEDIVFEIQPQEDGPDQAAIFASQASEFGESGRVWFTFAYDFHEVMQPFVDRVDSHATRLDERHGTGASVYLYDFRE